MTSTTLPVVLRVKELNIQHCIGTWRASSFSRSDSWRPRNEALSSLHAKELGLRFWDENALLTIFTVKIVTDLACSQRWYPYNTSGLRRQCWTSPQRTHLPIYANLLWFSVSFAKLRRSGPEYNFCKFWVSRRRSRSTSLWPFPPNLMLKVRLTLYKLRARGKNSR